MTTYDPPTLRMSAALVDDLERTGRSPRIGSFWDGRLDEWLGEMLDADPYARTQPDDLQTWSFPTDALLKEYLSTVGDREESGIRHLLRWFLFDAGTFGSDRDVLYWAVREGGRRDLLETEYGRRLLRSAAGKASAHSGVRWVLDLLPSAPRHALAVIDAYTRAHVALLPDGRLAGLSDAESIISARYISRSAPEAVAALRGISSRELEQLAGHLYEAMGYACTLTPRGNDGGRDVVAMATSPGRAEHRLVECKHYTGAVGVLAARALLGVVSHHHATTGVLLTTGTFTRGVRELAATNGRLDLVDGQQLIRMLNEHLGANWLSQLDYLLRWPYPNRS